MPRNNSTEVKIIILNALIVRKQGCTTPEIIYGISPERIKAALCKYDKVWSYRDTRNAAVFKEGTAELALQRSVMENKYMEWL